MPIIRRPFNLDVGNLATRVRMALRSQCEPGQQPTLHTEMKLVDPLPLYAGGGNQFIRDDLGTGPNQVGWRALILTNDDVPVACVDIRTRAGRRPTYVIRGECPARALMNLMLEAERLSPELSGEYEARYIAFPALFISALWLAGTEHYYFVSHTEPHPRPARCDITHPMLLDLVRERIRIRS